MSDLRSAALAAAFILLGNVASAATVSVSGTCGGLSGFETGPGDVRVGDADTSLDGGCVGSAKARVGAGYVGASARVATRTTSPSGGDARATATTNYALTISTPSTYTGGEIDVQVLFGLVYSLGGASDTNDTNNSLRQAQVDARYTLNGTSSSGRGTDSRNTRKLFQAEEYDSTDGFGGSETIASSVLSINPTGGLLVSFALSVAATMVSTDNQVSVFAGAFDTFSFATDGPSFILPDGFFVNSTEASIVNNVWIDPRIPDDPSAVPLPATLPLLFLGGLVLGAVGRNGRRKQG